MSAVPPIWHGYGVRRARPGQPNYWVRVGTDPRWLRLFVAHADTAVVPIRVMPREVPAPDSWWGAWDVDKARWAFVAPSRTALTIYFPTPLAGYAADGLYCFMPVRIEEATEDP